MQRLFTHRILIYGKEPYFWKTPFGGNLFLSMGYPGGTHNLLTGERVQIPKLENGDQLVFSISIQTPEELQPKPKVKKTRIVKVLEWILKRVS